MPAHLLVTPSELRMKKFVVTFTLLLCIPGILLEDFYKLLGINKDASNRDIRKAFKKLALKYHPDKNSEDDAHEKFLNINRAYEVNIPDKCHLINIVYLGLKR